MSAVGDAPPESPMPMAAPSMMAGAAMMGIGMPVSSLPTTTFSSMAEMRQPMLAPKTPSLLPQLPSTTSIVRLPQRPLPPQPPQISVESPQAQSPNAEHLSH